jgi:two-component system cell cycle response regulator
MLEATIFAKMNSAIPPQPGAPARQNVLLTCCYPVTGITEDSAFLDRLNSSIIEHLSDPCLRVDVLARQMNITLPTLYRKIKSVSNSTPNEMINAVRLNKPAELLPLAATRFFKIFKMVGFHSRSNFGEAFEKQSGLTTKEYYK